MRCARASTSIFAQLYGFELIEGAARFVGPDHLDVDSSRVSASRYLIATGAAPAVPDLPGLADLDFLTSTSAMELREVPEHLIVIGGGFVGLEQAQLPPLGAAVTLIGRFAPHAEPELSDVLAQVFRDEGIALITARASSIEGTHGVAVALDDRHRGQWQPPLGSHRTSSPNGRSRSERGRCRHRHPGAILTDQHQRTTSPNIYAAGDVTNSPQLVYLAAAPGAAAAENAIGNLDSSVDLTGLPSVIFTDPPLRARRPSRGRSHRQGNRCRRPHHRPRQGSPGRRGARHPRGRQDRRRQG